MIGKKPKVEISRESALDARPLRRDAVRSTVEGNGELSVVVEFERAGWLKRLDGKEHVRKTFVLDGLGREVYEACDGKQSVKDIVSRFAQEHHVSVAEAEYSVTTYLKTLMGKGLVGMELGPPSPSGRGSG